MCECLWQGETEPSHEQNKTIKRWKLHHNFSLTLTLPKEKWACKRMFTCTGKYSHLEKTVKMRNFAPATHYNPSTSSRRWRGTARLHNIYWNFSLGRWKEAVRHGNNSGGWQHVSRTGWAHQTAVAWRRDPGVLRQGSRVPAQRLGCIVGDTSCWTAGCCCCSKTAPPAQQPATVIAPQPEKMRALLRFITY